MTPPKPLTEWQQQNLPEVLPRHIRRNIEAGQDGCWAWRRSRDDDGYGWASYRNKTHLAHRLVYALVVGKPPEGLHLDHLCHSRNLATCGGGSICRHRRCVNPDHLEPVTVRENLRRGFTTTGMTECALGHPLTQIKTQRRCLVCRDAKAPEAQRRYRANRRQRALDVSSDDALVVAYRDTAKTYPGGHRDSLGSPGAVIRIWAIGGAA